MAQSNVVFDIQDVSKVFRSRRKEVQALSHIRLQVKKNEFVALLGTSGCGKSTLLRMLCGLDFPTEGEIFWNGERITGPGMDRGMVFQGYTLFPWMRVLDNVAYGLRASGMSKQERMDVAKQFLSDIGLEDFTQVYPSQLSGGMRQRVAIARALAMDPKVMLLDEPTSALDPELVGEVLSVIRDLADGGMTMIMATHQMDFARALATDILFMEQGKIIEQGAPDVLLAPGSGTRTSDFCGKLFDLRGTEKSDEPTVSELLTGDLSHDITDDGSESSMIPDAPKKD